MDPQPSYRQCAIATLPFLRCRHRLGHHCACLGLIGIFGVLAFLFSAISPDDDDIQQEFVQNNKAKQLAVANYKVRELRTFCTSNIRPALLPQTLPAICCGVRERARIVDKRIPGTILSRRTAARSPPVNFS